MPRALTLRLVCIAALLTGLLLMPACNQSDEEVTQLRASLQGAQARYQKLATDKTQADQQIADLKTRAEAIAAERDALKAKLASAQDRVKQLDNKVKELKKTRATAHAAPVAAAAPAAAALPTKADIDKVLARLEGVGADLYRDGNYNAVNAVLLSACDLGSKDPLTFYRLAYATASAGKYADAVGWYEKVLAALDHQAHPDTGLQAQCLNNYGVALTRTGKTSEAIAAYTKALGDIPDYTPALYNLALLYSKNASDHAKAANLLRRYIANGGTRSVSARAMLKDLLPEPSAPPASPAR